MINSLLIANRGEIACRIIRVATATRPRHAELVSASMPRSRTNSGSPTFTSNIEAWVLKQVQDDDRASCSPLRLSQSPLNRQIAPIRIASLDQVDLPCTMPALQLFLARDGIVHPVEELGMDKADRAVSRGKAGRSAGAMLPKTRREIGRDANVDRTALHAGENVGTGVSFAGHIDSMDDGAAWMLKRVQHDGRETKRA